MTISYANGRITTVIDGNGNRADLHYDGHGRQDRWTFPSATRAPAFNDATPATALATAGAVNPNDYEEYGYDPIGNRTSLRKRDGSVIAYSYDALNRMIVKTVPERADLTAAQTRDVYYSYDLRNLQLSARFDSPSGEGIANLYDGFGRLVRSIFNLGGIPRQLDYGYDAAGNRTSITYPDGIAVTTQYDALGRAYFMHTPAACCLAYRSFLPHGAPDGISRADGSGTWMNYDAVQRVATMGQTFPGGAGNVVTSFWRNAAGQLAGQVRDNDAYAWTGHYAVNRAYTTNGLNQYSAAGGATFGYDANGNLTSDGSRSYVYDIENRLVSTSTGAALVYDPLGRLFQVSTPTTGTTTFLYDGDALVAEYNGGAMIRRHLHWPGADVPMMSWEGAGFAPRHLHADERGSIIAVDNANGLPTINTYDEYGIPGVGNVGRFQYTGQAWLPELGMYYYKARIYSPTLGRFMQTDPVGYADQFNLYGYVGNDPINRTDPDGRYSCGQGMSGTQCSQFNAAQSRAASQLRSSIGALRGLRSRLASGRLTATDRRVQSQMNRYLGQGAGSSDRVISATINTATSMLGMLESDIPANMHAQQGRAYLSTPPGGAHRELQVFRRFFENSTDNQRTQSLAHDAHHGGTGSRDTGWGNIGPYGERNVLNRARAANNPMWVLTNPDAATMALGFTRDDD